MALTKSSLSSIPTCYATVSIGTPDTPLDQKLEAIAGAGFQGIELGFPDLLSFASKRQNKDVQPQDFDTLCDAAGEVKQLVEKNGLKIVMLQPFPNFEGWPEGSDGREDAFRRAKGWIRIMEAVGTDMLQVMTARFVLWKAKVPGLTGFPFPGWLHRLTACSRLPGLPRLRSPTTR